MLVPKPMPRELQCITSRVFILKPKDPERIKSAKALHYTTEKIKRHFPNSNATGQSTQDLSHKSYRTYHLATTKSMDLRSILEAKALEKSKLKTESTQYGAIKLSRSESHLKKRPNTGDCKKYTEKQLSEKTSFDSIKKASSEIPAYKLKDRGRPYTPSGTRTARKYDIKKIYS